MNLAIRLRQQGHRKKRKKIKNKEITKEQVNRKKKREQDTPNYVHPKILMHSMLFPKPPKVFNLHPQLVQANFFILENSSVPLPPHNPPSGSQS